jgi:hypothetical protein
VFFLIIKVSNFIYPNLLQAICVQHKKPNEMATLFHSAGFRSRLSFQPLVTMWSDIADQEDTVAGKMCARLVQKFARHPELLEPSDNYSIIEKHQLLIEEGMATIFPPIMSRQKEVSAVAVPFSNKVIFASPLFKKNYVDEKNNYVLPLDPQVEENIDRAKFFLAYKLIFKKYYNLELTGADAFICAYPEPAQNIHNYFELQWYPQFITVSTSMEELPALPETFLAKGHHVHELEQYPEIFKLLPVEEFLFDGIIIVRIREVTRRETISRIRDVLLRIHSLDDPEVLPELQHQVRFLTHREEIELGVTSFFHLDRNVAWAKINNTSLLFRNTEDTDKIRNLSYELTGILNQHPYILWPSGSANGGCTQTEEHLKQNGWKSGLIFALRNGRELIGCLELFTKEDTPLEASMAPKMEGILELLQVAMQNTSQQVYGTVSQLVKEHFTAVQSSVEWKFDDVAIDYLLKQKKGLPVRMQPIVFEQVYPLYGIIDISNSSGQRNLAVQKDLLYQLHWIQSILFLAQDHLSYPILEEIHLRVDEYIASISNILLTKDEQAIQSFLRAEVMGLLQQFRDMIPAISREIDEYINGIGGEPFLFNKYHRQFEESITAINNYIVRFLELEQEEAQRMYPHYFERFVSDGVEFNMYIGQSIIPYKKFNTVHLQNLRLWQVSLLANAAQRLYHLGAGMPVPLETTQLLLVYNEAISISFRTAERKFDIDGVQHVRYEVLKKRIDKVKIKDSIERLTKPGTIAIVYNTEDDAKEYLQYIHYLEKQNIVTGNVEKLELEDLQGVSGLKALRVQVLLEKENQPDKENIKTTSLLR